MKVRRIVNIDRVADLKRSQVANAAAAAAAHDGFAHVAAAGVQRRVEIKSELVLAAVNYRIYGAGRRRQIYHSNGNRR